MRIQSTTFFITTVFVIISLTTSVIFEYSCLKNTIWQQLSLAIFSASSMSCILSYVYYCIEKQKTLAKMLELWAFVYQKTLNINVLISDRTQRQSSQEIIVGREIYITSTLMREDIQNSLEKLRTIEYWQNIPDKRHRAFTSMSSNVSLINSFICNLVKVEIFANQWQIYELENNLNASASILPIYEELLNELKEESTKILSNLDLGLDALIKARKNKAVSWKTLKQEFERSAKEFNHIQ